MRMSQAKRNTTAHEGKVPDSAGRPGMEGQIAIGITPNSNLTFVRGLFCNVDAKNSQIL